MTKQRQIQNKCQIWRIANLEWVMKHIVETSDWLTHECDLTPSKIYEMWSVLDIEVELEHQMKTFEAQKRVKAVAKKTVNPVKVTTPVKTRGQRKEHSKVRKVVRVDNVM